MILLEIHTLNYASGSCNIHLADGTIRYLIVNLETDKKIAEGKPTL